MKSMGWKSELSIFAIIQGSVGDPPMRASYGLYVRYAHIIHAGLAHARLLYFLDN